MPFQTHNKIETTPGPIPRFAPSDRATHSTHSLRGSRCPWLTTVALNYLFSLEPRRDEVVTWVPNLNLRARTLERWKGLHRRPHLCMGSPCHELNCTKNTPSLRCKCSQATALPSLMRPRKHRVLQSTGRSDNPTVVSINWQYNFSASSAHIFDTPLLHRTWIHYGPCRNKHFIY